MAKATLREHRDPDPLSADELLALIEGLFHDLQALPPKDQPCYGRGQYHGSPAYQAIEAQVRDYAQQFWTLTEARLD